MSRWKIEDVMTTDVASVSVDTSFREIVDVLAERHISAVPVVDAARRVVGVVSEADLLHKMEFAGESMAARLFEGQRHRRARTKAAGIDPVTVGGGGPRRSGHAGRRNGEQVAGHDGGAAHPSGGGVVDVVDRLTHRYDDTADRGAYGLVSPP
jgi:hypothetical protein